MTLIQRNAASGQFTLEISLEKSPNLTAPYVPFPMNAGGASITGQGNLQYQFTTPDNAAFFRLQSR